MILTTTAHDSLTLAIAKEHLYIEHNDDDAILDVYIAASLGIVEDYIHAPALERTYETTALEMQTLAAAGFKLVLADNPTSVTVDNAGHIYELPASEYSYHNNVLTIKNGSSRQMPTKIIAKAGKSQHAAQLLQARLLLIGSYYSFRNNDIDLRINELPTGVKMILGNCTDVSL